MHEEQLADHEVVDCDEVLKDAEVIEEVVVDQLVLGGCPDSLQYNLPRLVWPLGPFEDWPHQKFSTNVKSTLRPLD